MANNKVSYGQYVAYAVGNSARFSVSGRPGLIKRGDVPENIAVHLETQLGLEPKETKSNLDKTMEAELPKTQPAPVEPQFEAPLELSDFDDGVDMDAATQQIAEFYGVPELPPVPEGIPLGPRLQDADIYQIAQELSDRFGVYTAWLKRYPEDGEISPVTGELMPLYERGVYYQYARRILNQNTLNGRDYEDMKAQQAFAKLRSQEIRRGYDQPMPAPTVQQSQQANDFAYRTSVQGGNAMSQHVAPPIVHVTNAQGVVQAVRGEMPSERPATISRQTDEGPVSEPNFGGQIIRPNW